MNRYIALPAILIVMAIAGCEDAGTGGGGGTAYEQEPLYARKDPSAGKACIGVDDDGRRQLVSRARCGYEGGAVRD